MNETMMNQTPKNGVELGIMMTARDEVKQWPGSINDNVSRLQSLQLADRKPMPRN